MKEEGDELEILGELCLGELVTGDAEELCEFLVDFCYHQLFLFDFLLGLLPFAAFVPVDHSDSLIIEPYIKVKGSVIARGRQNLALP